MSPPATVGLTPEGAAEAIERAGFTSVWVGGGNRGPEDFQVLRGLLSGSERLVVAPGIEEQTTRVMENLKSILEAAGSSLAQVVKATVFLKDFNDFAAMNAVYGAYLAPEGVAAPARSTVEVSRLPKDVLVEIELIGEV